MPIKISTPSGLITLGGGKTWPPKPKPRPLPEVRG
jgi:hypothetical protein